MLLIAVGGGGVAAQFVADPFENGSSWFISPLGGGVLPPATAADPVRVDSDGDGIVDTDYSIAMISDLHPTTGTFVYRLSPNQQTLYVSKTGGTCTGVEILIYDLSTPGTLRAFTSSQGPACLTSVDIGPTFYDQSGAVRTMVVVGGGNSTTAEVLWADLVGAQYSVDRFTYQKNVAQVQFAPSGNAAFIVHDDQTANNDGLYSFIDLCEDPLGGSRNTPQFFSGIPSARVTESSPGNFEAEFLLGGTPQTGSQFALSEACFGGSSSFACCRVGMPCTTTASADECTQLGGTAVPGDCNDTPPPCTEACCNDGACSLVTYDECLINGGTPQSSETCGGITCPQPNEACCMPDGSCWDIPAADCTGTPQGPGSECYGGSPVVCPAPEIALTLTGPTEAASGEQFVYVIDYTNVGTAATAGLTITDDLPFELTVVSVGGGGTEVYPGHVEWDLGVLAAGAGGQVTVTVEVGCAEFDLFNQAQATTVEQIFSSSNPVQTSPTIPTGAVSATISSIPEQGLPVEGNHLVTHTISLDNSGDQPRRSLSIRFAPGAGMAFESVLDAGGGQIDATSFPGEWVWQGDAAALGSTDIVFTTRIDSCIDRDDVQLHDGRIAVKDPCGETLSTLDPPALAVRRAIEVGVVATNLNPPARLERVGDRFQLMQLAREGWTIEFEATIRNPHPLLLGAVTAFMSLPGVIDFAGQDPFLGTPPAGTSWDSAARSIIWSGAIAGGGTVTIRYGGTLTAAPDDTCSVTTWVNANEGSCAIASAVTVANVPDVSGPHVIGIKGFGEGQLLYTRPGIDTEARNLLCWDADLFDGTAETGMGRGANGDIWVTTSPVFRFNPETLEIAGVPRSVLDEDNFIPRDVAVDPTDGSAVFVGATLIAGPWGATVSGEIRRYDPATEQMSVVFDGDPGTFSEFIHVAVEPGGSIGALVVTGFVPYIYRFSPAGSYDPVPLNSTISVGVGGLSIDENGNYLTIGHLQIGAPWDIYQITPGGWSTIVAPDLYSLIPSAGSTFASLAIVAAAPDGDIYVGESFDGGIGVVHRQPALGGADVLPFGVAFNPAVYDLAYSPGGSCDDADGDGAGVGLGCTATIDCNDGDADVYPGAVELNDGKDNQCPGDNGYGFIDELPGTSGFLVPGDKTQFCWEAQGGTATYEIVRSDSPDFSSGCTSSTVSSTCSTDAADPDPGQAWYYLARPLTPFPGSWGAGAGGAERVVTCP